METPEIHVSPSAEVALVREYPPLQFVDIKHLCETAEARRIEVERNPNKCVYLSFRDVTPADLVGLEKYCEQTRLHFRFTYFPDIEVLIVKIPVRIHEKAHRGFGQFLSDRFCSMGVGRTEFKDLGETTKKSQHRPPGQNASQKSGDTSFCNKLLHPGQDVWPSLVIEAGNTESLPHLRADAEWWIQNSNRQVRIVILLRVDEVKKKMSILKYVPKLPLATYPDEPSTMAHQVADITVDQSTSPSVIHGAPLKLEFAEIFGRKPTPPNEGDLVLTAQDLDEYVSKVW